MPRAKGTERLELCQGWGGQWDSRKETPELVASQDPQSRSPHVGPCQGRSQRAPLWFVGCWTQPLWCPGKCPACWHILWNAEPCARPKSPSCPSALVPTPLSCESTCQEPWARPNPRALHNPALLLAETKMVTGDYSQRGSSCCVLVRHHPTKH